MNKKKSKKSISKTNWWARTVDIVRIGPFSSQAKASKAILGLDGNPILGAFVWPEKINANVKR